MNAKAEKTRITLELPYKHPKNLAEVAENYQVLQEQIREHVKRLALQDPEGRQLAYRKLKPIKDRVDCLTRELEEFEAEFFTKGPPRLVYERGRPVKKWRKVKPLGMVGRAILCGTATEHLEVASGILEEILKSLKGR